MSLITNRRMNKIQTDRRDDDEKQEILDKIENEDSKLPDEFPKTNLEQEGSDIENK